MSDPEQYRNQIKQILSESDLSTITTKKVRLELEKNTGQSLTAIKKEINEIIQEAFEGLSSQQETLQETSQEASQEVVKHERSPTKNPVKKTTVSKSTKKTTPEKRKREMPLVRILPPLSYIVKTDYCSRTQTVSKMWEYIREHKLQDVNNKRFIDCDDHFKVLCNGLERISMFEISKYIQKYMEKLSDEEQAKRNPKKDNSEKPLAKKPKRAPRDMPILKILPPLSDIIKTEYCSRTQTVSKAWEYIRENNLQNPKDKRLIDCDDKFKELCDGQTQVSAFAFNKYTQKCFVKIPEEEQVAVKKSLYGNQSQPQNDFSE